MICGEVKPVYKPEALPLPGPDADVSFIGDFAGSRETKDLLELLIAPDALGRPFVASKQVPADRVAVIRQAFDRTMQDAQFLAEMAKLDLPVSGPIAGAQAEKIIASIYAAPPALIARVQEVVGK